jgi:hypothetical protein
MRRIAAPGIGFGINAGIGITAPAARDSSSSQNKGARAVAAAIPATFFRIDIAADRQPRRAQQNQRGHM